MTLKPNSPSSPADARWFLGTAIAVVLLVYAWAAHGSNHGNFSAPKPNGFYAMLTEALLAGQTHLKLAPDPRLLKLADPYLDEPWLPRLHDATYFQGRYYIYFGPGAAVVLLGPWKLLTGEYLSDGAATAILVTADFLLGCLLLWKIWRRWFATRIPRGWLAAAVLFWGLGNYLCILFGQATFYFVPIAFAHGMGLGALLAIWQSMVSTTWRRATGWFALAAFLWAGALSGRPNYLLSLSILIFPFLHLRSVAATRFNRRSGTWPLLFAAGLPIAAVGITLATYNWVRYHKLTEFGVHLQFAMGDQRQTKLYEWVNFGPSLKWYLLSFPDLSPYFPFMQETEGGYSLLFCGPLMLIAFLFPLSLRKNFLSADPLWRILGLCLATAAVINFISLLGVPWANERYFGDFIPLLTLLALCTMWFLAQSTGSAAPALRIGLRVAIGALATWTVAFTGIFLLGRYPERAAIEPVRRFAIGVVSRIEQWRNIGHGPLHLQVVFAENPANTLEPLVVCGHGKDMVFVKYLTPKRVQFGFFHTGNPAVLSEPVEIKPGTPHQLDVNLGAFYPPPEHPAFAGWNETQRETLTSIVTVRFDDAEVLRTRSIFYLSHPDDIHLGRNAPGRFTARNFSGTLAVTAPSTMPSPADLAVRRSEGPVKLTLTLPAFTVFRSEPLVSTGRRGGGDIVYVSYIGPNRLRFGHDSAGHGAVTSEVVDYDPQQPHVVEIEMGSLRTLTATTQSPLIVRFDGRTLFDEVRFFNPSSAEQVVFGFNAMGSGVVAEAFGGHISSVETVGPLPRTSLLASTQSYGTVRLALRFPHGAPNESEPLLVTGRTGKGDIVYVTYLDDTHVKFGVDHWGVGACSSETVTIDPDKDHVIDISIGSLFPSVGDSWWSNTPAGERERRHSQVIIQLDGATVIDKAQAAHPSTSEEVAIGTNPIGASTCGPTFRGKISTASRLPPP